MGRWWQTWVLGGLELGLKFSYWDHLSSLPVGVEGRVEGVEQLVSMSWQKDRKTKAGSLWH